MITGDRALSGQVLLLNSEAVVLTGTSLRIVRAAVTQFLEKRDGPLQPEAAHVLQVLLRAPRALRHKGADGPPLAAASTHMDTGQAAAILGITAAGVRARIHRGALPAERTADGWRIRTLDLGIIT